MFVGFEDTEFSVRVFQKGFKVGTCGVCCIIHDHPKPKNDADTHYEKQRFSVNYLQESAKVFEKKHGFAVWNPNVAKWINQRRDELISEREPGKTGLASSDEKPGVALIVDKPDWALDHIAKQVQKNLASFYDFKIIYLKDFDNLAEVLMLAEDAKSSIFYGGRLLLIFIQRIHRIVFMRLEWIRIPFIGSMWRAK